MAGADMDISMWLTMTTHTGRCTPLVGVQSQPSTVKETDMLLPWTALPKRFNSLNLCFALNSVSGCYTYRKINMVKKSTGDKKS